MESRNITMIAKKVIEILVHHKRRKLLHHISASLPFRRKRQQSLVAKTEVRYRIKEEVDGKGDSVNNP